MKNFKRFLALFLTFIFIGTGQAFALYYDAPDGWAGEFVSGARTHGLLPEELDSNYRADITREEFCLLAVTFIEKFYEENMETIAVQKGISMDKSPFIDVNNKNIDYCYRLGIVSGRSANIFDPKSSITRQEAAVMVTKMAEVIGVSAAAYNYEPEYDDKNNIEPWAVNSVNFVTEKSIMSGTGRATFSPNLAYSRQQAITTFYNAFLNLNISHIETKPVTILGKEVRLGDSQTYVNSQFGTPNDVFESESSFTWNVFHNNFADTILIGIENGVVKAIATNSYVFSYDRFIKSGDSEEAVNQHLANTESVGVRFIYDRNKLDGIYLLDSTVSYHSKSSDAYKKEMFYFMNTYRIKNGLSPFNYNEELEDIAYNHSRNMATEGYFNEKSPSGDTITGQLLKAGIKFDKADISILRDVYDGFYAHEKFLNTPGAYDNIIDEYTDVGIGVYVDKNNKLFITQVYTK